jgi:hypothetical protein
MNGSTVTCDSLDLYTNTDNNRTLDFNSSTVNITGGGVYTSGANQIVLDLRDDNNGNITISGAANATINFTGNVDDVCLQLGRRGKAVPNLIFTGTNDQVIIFTRVQGNCSGRKITIGDITIIKTGVRLHLDDNETFFAAGSRGNGKYVGALITRD